MKKREAKTVADFCAFWMFQIERFDKYNRSLGISQCGITINNTVPILVIIFITLLSFIKTNEV